MLRFYNYIYLHICLQAIAFKGNTYASHGQVIRTHGYSDRQVDDDGNSRRTPCWTTHLISYISLITKCAQITVSQKVQARSKICCIPLNFGLIQKGGRWLCHGTNAYYSPNLKKKNRFRLFFITEVNDILCEFQIESGLFSLELFVIHVNLKIKSFNGFYTLRPRYKLNASELAMPNQ